MATVETIEISITNEGLVNLANAIVVGTISGVVSTVDFKIGFFRLANYGDPTTYDDYKVDRDTCGEVYYSTYTKDLFDDDHTLDTAKTDYIAINSIEYIAPVAPETIGTVEIGCYVPPGYLNLANSSSFSCNEIMVYTGAGTTDNPYQSFIYGIFPAMSKISDYGLNLKITCQF